MSIPSWFTKRLSESARSASGCVSFSGLTGSRNGPITSSAMKARSIERETLMRKGMASSSTTPSLRELLLAPELRLAFFQEGGGAFLHVFRGGGKAEQVRFHLQSFLKARAEPPHDCLLGEAQGHGRVGDHLPRQLQGFCLRVLGDPVDESQLQCFFRFHVPAREDEVQGTGRADEPRQALRATVTGDEAEADLGEAEPGSGRCHPQLPGPRYLKSSAERETVQRRNRRHGQGSERVEDVLTGK